MLSLYIERYSPLLWGYVALSLFTRNQAVFFTLRAQSMGLYASNSIHFLLPYEKQSLGSVVVTQEMSRE